MLGWLLALSLSGCAPPPPAAVEPTPTASATVPLARPLEQRPVGLKPDAAGAAIPGHLGELPGYAEANRSLPAPASAEALKRGQKLYAAGCQGCHGDQGQGVSGRGYTTRNPARDLRAPAFYKYGSSQRAVFRTIKFGIPGSPMGSYEGVMSDEQLWDLTLYVLSLHEGE